MEIHAEINKASNLNGKCISYKCFPISNNGKISLKVIEKHLYKIHFLFESNESIGSTTLSLNKKKNNRITDLAAHNFLLLYLKGLPGQPNYNGIHTASQTPEMQNPLSITEIELLLQLGKNF
jgi:hypothetical protein